MNTKKSLEELMAYHAAQIEKLKAKKERAQYKHQSTGNGIFKLTTTTRAHKKPLPDNKIVHKIYTAVIKDGQLKPIHICSITGKNNYWAAKKVLSTLNKIESNDEVLNLLLEKFTKK